MEGFARPMGFSRQHVQKIEADTALPSLEFLHRLADVHKADLREFFTS